MDRDMTRLGWLALGAGSKGVIGGTVSGFIPQVGVTPDIVTAFLGFWLAGQGGKWISPFGEGMLIASIGQIVRQPIEALVGGFMQPKKPTPEQPVATKTSSNAGNPETLDGYLAATYGIA
ncbi:hypothetical protein ES705_14571 [subsurface metagenome]